jgi:hypothetical protein
MDELESTKVWNLCLSLVYLRDDKFDASGLRLLMQSPGRASSDIDCDTYERLVTLAKGNDPLGDKNGTETKTHQVAWTSRHKPINPA